MPAENTHELGRRGALEAKELLWRLLGDRIRLPFNAYDHPEKLVFDQGVPFGVSRFSFDLRGNLERSNDARFGGKDAVEVFVEVKHYQNGDSLLGEFQVFLQHAAVAASLPAHTTTWFLFVVNVPFGSSKGVHLCDGTYLNECSATWHATLKDIAPRLTDRLAVIIATQSFTRLLDYWSVS